MAVILDHVFNCIDEELYEHRQSGRIAYNLKYYNTKYENFVSTQ